MAHGGGDKSYDREREKRREQMVKALLCCLEEPEFHPRAHDQCLKDHPQESTSREKEEFNIEMGGGGRAGEQRRERNKKNKRSVVS